MWIVTDEAFMGYNQSILFDMYQTNGIINFKTYNTIQV